MNKGSISTRAIAGKFQRYADEPAPLFGHADRVEPFEAYCKGLLLPSERKRGE